MGKTLYETGQYHYFALQNTQHDLRVALFERMQQEGLLTSALHSYQNPTVADWLQLTQEGEGWLVCCCCKNATGHDIQDIRAMAYISPIKGKLWSFDFTVFRAHFSEAIAMSQGALSWIFAQEHCQSLLGICSISNRHAWRLAQAAGFRILGTAQEACFSAKKQCYEGGVIVMASADIFAQA